MHDVLSDPPTVVEGRTVIRLGSEQIPLDPDVWWLLPAGTHMPPCNWLCMAPGRSQCFVLAGSKPEFEFSRLRVNSPFHFCTALYMWT